MNSRIAEIATQCGWEDWTQDDNWKHWASEERGYFVLADLEDFASKIIQDCITKAEEQGINSGFDIEHNHAIRQVVAAIKHHFGLVKNV